MERHTLLFEMAGGEILMLCEISKSSGLRETGRGVGGYEFCMISWGFLNVDAGGFVHQWRCFVLRNRIEIYLAVVGSCIGVIFDSSFGMLGFTLRKTRNMRDKVRGIC